MTGAPPRAVRLVGAGLLVAALVTGCAAPVGHPDASGTLTVLVPASPVTDQAFAALNTSFQAAYPEVDLRFSAVDPDDFVAARTTGLANGSIDVTVAQPSETPDWVTNDSDSPDSVAARSGVFVDLSRKPFLKNYIPSVVDLLRYNGKAYAIPSGISYSTGVFYNRDLFEKLHLKVPTTWSGFLEVAGAIRDAGVTPLGVAGADPQATRLCLLAVVQGLYPTPRERSTLAENIWRNRTGLAAGTQLQVYKRLATLYSLAGPAIAETRYDAIPGSFADGDFAMTIDGTWDQRAIDAAVGDRFDYGYFPLPAGDDAADNAHLGARLELSLVAAEHGPNSAAALAYLDYFSRPGPYGRFIDMTGFASSQTETIVGNDFLSGIGKYTGLYSPDWDMIWTPNTAAEPAASAAFDFADIAPLGSLTPEEAAQASQAAWDSARAGAP